MSQNPVDLIINSTWRPFIEIIGVDGIPQSEIAGNVLRPYTSVKINVRLPPTCDSNKALETLKQKLTQNVPYNAHVELKVNCMGDGWNAPPNQKYLDEYISQASMLFFKKKGMGYGGKGGIPLMNTLSKLFPNSQFIVTGLL